jgi:general nucleoside transport system permease protein
VLQALVDDPADLTIEETVARAREGGLIIRRLPYTGAGMGLAAFLTIVTGLFALVAGARVVRAVNRPLDRALAAMAIPAVSIVLALAAAAVVILVMQPTPRASAFEFEGPLIALAGRLDTLWLAYYTMFAESLGTAKGFADALSFATPLIFTGLAVGFGFRAGLFNIGAPGADGPRRDRDDVRRPLHAGTDVAGAARWRSPRRRSAAAVGRVARLAQGPLRRQRGHQHDPAQLRGRLAAAVHALVEPDLRRPAVRVIQLIGVVVGVMVVALLVPWLRRQMGRGPRVVLALVGVGVLVGAVVVSQPRPGDAPYVLQLPFKVPGSEPKSYELQPTARLPRLPAVFGIDLRQTPGTNVVPVDVALPAALLLGVVALVAPTACGARRRRAPGWAAPPARRSWRTACSRRSAGVRCRGDPAEQPQPLVPDRHRGGRVRALLPLPHALRLRTARLGLSPKAAEYGGASLRRNTVMAMTISGALAGLTATHYVLGGALEDYALRQSIPTSDGFDGIAVALLGGNSPVGIVLAAFLFGVLKNGGSLLNITFSNLTRDVVSMILALVVLFIAAKGFLPERLTNPLRRAKALGDLPPEVGDGKPDRPPDDVPRASPGRPPTGAKEELG